MLRTEKGLISILGVTAFVNFFFFSATPLLQVVGGKFNVGPALLGLLAAMLGIGMFAGSLGIAHYQPRRCGLLYVVGSYIAFVFMTGFALVPLYGLRCISGSSGSGNGFLRVHAVGACYGRCLRTTPRSRVGSAE